MKIEVEKGLISNILTVKEERCNKVNKSNRRRLRWSFVVY